MMLFLVLRPFACAHDLGLETFVRTVELPSREPQRSSVYPACLLVCLSVCFPTLQIDNDLLKRKHLIRYSMEELLALLQVRPTAGGAVGARISHQEERSDS